MISLLLAWLALSSALEEFQAALNFAQQWQPDSDGWRNDATDSEQR
ncbi:MAG: hypothetical protein OXH76_18525 [Boseongicola sp.]|nr:hypothetical protein [Boseongicola sp.]